MDDSPIITGAGRRHQESARQLERRVFTFPDGVARFITLERRYWRALDCVSEFWGDSVSDFMAYTDIENDLKWAHRRNVSLEESISNGLIGRIRGALDFCQTEIRKPVNENCFEQDPRYLYLDSDLVEELVPTCPVIERNTAWDCSSQFRKTWFLAAEFPFHNPDFA